MFFEEGHFYMEFQDHNGDTVDSAYDRNTYTIAD
jgi:hypothetical protein